LLEGTDIDSDPITFSIENLPSFLILTKMSNTSAVLSGIFSNKDLGDNLLKLTLSDGILSTKETITISVVHVDHAPYVKYPIENISVDKRASDKIVDLKTVFADDDPGDILTYSVESNTNNKVVQATVAESNLILSFSDENTGFSEITVTGSCNGKVAKSTFTVEVKVPTGIDPNVEEVEGQIYPNQTKGKGLLKFSKIPEANTWITVFDVSGRMISRFMPDNKEQFINLEGNCPGLYFIKVDQKIIKSYKLILE